MDQLMSPMSEGMVKALAAAQAEFGPALKSSNNPHFKSRYADLASVLDAAVPALNKHGIFFTQKTHVVEGGVCVESLLFHGTTNYSGGLFFVPASKSDAQGFGSAMTYARRYSAMPLFGLAPEDDDGNAASNHPPVQPPQAVKATPLSDAAFADKSPVWIEMIRSGKKSYDQMIEGLAARCVLTDAQKAVLIEAGSVAEDKKLSTANSKNQNENPQS